MKRRTDGLLMKQIVVGHDPFTGKPIRKSVYGKTAEELNNKMIDLKKQVKDGVFDVFSKGSLNEFFEQWIKGRSANLDESTVKSYRSHYRSMWQNTIGELQLKKIELIDIVRVITDRYNSGKNNADTIRNRVILLNDILDDALKMGKIMKNHCEIALENHLPKKDQEKEKVIMDRGQIPVFTQTAETCRHYTAYMLELCTGLRRGELLGLSWDTVSLEAGLIKVCQQLTPEKKIKKRLKHNAKPRTIQIPVEMVEILKQHKAEQDRRREMLGAAYDPDGLNLVFCFDDGSPLNPQSFYRTYKRILKKAGFNADEMTFHSLRHLFITTALEEGTKVKTVQEIVGHKHASTTLDVYAHVTKAQVALAAENVGAVIFTKKIQALNTNSKRLAVNH